MDIVWQKCVDSFTVEIFRCNGYFSGMFCSWSPESVCGWVTKTGCTLPEIATAHGWTTTGYQLERTMAWHSAWVARPHRATVGMQWLQNVVAQIFDGILEICKLCRFVAWRQVGQTCVGLASTTKENWTNIHDLGLAITTFWSMAASWGLVSHSAGHRFMATLPEWFPYVYSEMIVQ